VRVWDLTEGRQLGDPLTGHTRVVESVACTMLGGRPVAVTGSWDGSVRVWDLTAGRQLGDPLTRRYDGVEAVACTVLGGRPVAVTGGVDGSVRVWDLTWHQGITRLDLPDKVGTLAITPGGELLVGFGWEIACLYPIGRIR
jgi:WD40 repeat protein